MAIPETKGASASSGFVCEGTARGACSWVPAFGPDGAGDDEAPLWFVAGSLAGAGDSYFVKEAARQAAQAATRTVPGLQAVNVGGFGGAEVCSFGSGNARLGHAVVQPGAGVEAAVARAGGSWWQKTGGNVAEFINGAAGKLAGRALVVFGAVTAASDVADMVRNGFDEDVSVLARSEWYQAMKAYRHGRALFGSAPDVPWIERLGWSALLTLDVPVPASWHKLLDPLLDPVASNWIDWCEDNLRAGRGCRSR